MLVIIKTTCAAPVRRDTERETMQKDGGFGKIISFHPRYRLGIQHGFEEPREFLIALVEKTVEPKAIVDYVLAGRSEGLQLQFSLLNETWDLISYFESDGNWDVADEFPSVQEHIPEIAEAILREIALCDLYSLAREENAVLPVYLPGADSPYLKTSLNAPVWIAGQMGWIYAEKRAINRKYHGTKEQVDRMIKAEAVLKNIVEGIANPRRKQAKKHCRL